MIAGHLPRKENERRIVRGRRGKPMSIKSEAAISYVAAVAFQVPADLKMSLGSEGHPLSVVGIVYYPWRLRGDLSVELLLDALQQARVISNDHHVVENCFVKGYSKDRPRVEVTVTELDDWNWEAPDGVALSAVRGGLVE